MEICLGYRFSVYAMLELSVVHGFSFMFKYILWKLIAGFVIHGIPKQTKVDNTLLYIMVWSGDA